MIMTRLWKIGYDWNTIENIVTEILNEAFPSHILELKTTTLYRHLTKDWFIRNQQDKYQHSITPQQKIVDGSIYSVRNHMEYLLNERKLTIGEYTQIQSMLRSDDVEMLKLAIRILFAKKIEEMKL